MFDREKLLCDEQVDTIRDSLLFKAGVEYQGDQPTETTPERIVHDLITEQITAQTGGDMRNPYRVVFSRSDRRIIEGALRFVGAQEGAIVENLIRQAGGLVSLERVDRYKAWVSNTARGATVLRHGMR